MNKIKQSLEQFLADLPDGAEIKFGIRGKKLVKVKPQEVDIPQATGKILTLKITNEVLLGEVE